MFFLKITCSDLVTVKTVDKVLKELGVSFIRLPKINKKITVLKSVHVNKKSKEHFCSVKFFRHSQILEKESVIKLLYKLPSRVSIKIKYSGNGAVW